MRKQQAKSYTRRVEALTVSAAGSMGADIGIDKLAAASADLMDSVGVAPADSEGSAWKPGEYIGKGSIREHNGTTYECISPHCTQSGWEPDKTPSLWAVINTENAGTKDDPVPAALGMEYFKGKHYSEGDTIYICIRDSGQALHHWPSTLVGNYFELAK